MEIIPLTLIVLGTLYYFLRKVRRGLDGWESTQGKILEFALSRRYTREGGGALKPVVFFEYQAQGFPYRSRNFFSFQNDMPFLGKVLGQIPVTQEERIQNRFGLGQKVEVFYRPGRPDAACLVVGLALVHEDFRENLRLNRRLLRVFSVMFYVVALLLIAGVVAIEFLL